MRAYKLLSGHQYYEVHDLKKGRWWTAKRQDDGGWYILSERNIPVSPDKTLGRKIVAAVLALNSETGTQNSFSAKSEEA